MDYSKVIFVVYMGGSAGDMVTSIIDSLNSEFDLPSRSIKMPRERQQLKKPYTFDSDLSKDKYVELMAKTYKSLPSHDHEYHVRSKHNCIGITVHNFNLAHWAASRFQSIHRPEVWNQVCQACGITDTRQYADLMLNYSSMIENKLSNLLKLERIMDGNLMLDINKYVDLSANKKSYNFYQNWLDLVSNRIFS